jgi:hypothetical protein
VTPRGTALVLALLLAQPGAALGAAPRPEALRSWGQYIRWADARFAAEIADGARFLHRERLPADARAEVLATLAAGRIAVRRITDVVPFGATLELPEAAIHHWWGTAMAPGVKLADVLLLAQDYDHHAGKFVEVERSRLLAHNGDTFRFFLRLRRTKAPVTVHYNTEHVCTYAAPAPGLATSRSVALKIAELDAAGTPQEREKSPDEDRGFLWRAVTWWRFKEIREGVIIECETASLSRNIPGWLRFIPGAVGYLESVPRESIENTLSTLRQHSR